MPKRVLTASITIISIAATVLALTHTWTHVVGSSSADGLASPKLPPQIDGTVSRALADSVQITSKMLGAVGNGSADDTAALQRINTAMNAGYTVRMEPGRYRTTNTVVFDAARGDLEAQGAIIVPDEGVLIAVQLGSDVRMMSSRLTGLVVDRMSFDSVRETEGFRFVNVSGVSLVDLEARYARYNFRLMPGDGQRVSYVTLINPKAIYGYRNFWANPVQAGSGFVTSVSVFGGRMAGSVGSHGPNSNTVENCRLDWKRGAVNLIRFYGVEMEGNQSVGCYVDAPSNTFDGLRFEGKFTTAAIQFGANAQYNVVIDTYPSTTIVDGGLSNRVMLAKQTRFPSFIGIGLNRAPNYPVEADQPNDGPTRYVWRNSSEGPARRVDTGLCTGPTVGKECLFYGIDQAQSIYKSYIDNRSGGAFVIQSSGAVTHTFGLDGSIKTAGGFSVFNVPLVTSRPTLPSALATDGSATSAQISKSLNSLRSLVISYGLAQ